MCRIIFLKWTNKEKALEYIDAFYKAGYDDPHLINAIRTLKLEKIKNQHLHGWWYLLVTSNNILTYLSWEAFYNDINWIKNLKDQIKNISWEFLLMSELRLTDEWHVSALNSHPFFFSTYNWYEGWFFYNWLLDHEKLANIEWFDIKNFKRKNGTTLIWHSISKELENWKTIKQSLLKPIETVKSGYNLMCFLNDNNWDYKAYLNAYSKKELLKNLDYLEYTKLIKKEDTDLFFAGSNAISCYRKDDYEIMKNEEFLEFDIDFINEYYFNAYDDWIEMNI